ncbi:hypothetical protein F5880DRAFT_1597960 [Lentinula raphanica]|nr:hypothetical protein F5880DRAFT_1597960 [Lentinula raphanica]
MTRLTRLTLRAILVLGVLSSGALAAPASTLPLTNDQALDQCSDSHGGSSLALRARGCMSSREGANEGGGNGEGANGEGEGASTAADGHRSRGSRGRARKAPAAAQSHQKEQLSGIGKFNTLMSKLGHDELRADSEEQLLENINRLPVSTDPHDPNRSDYMDLFALFAALSKQWLRQKGESGRFTDPYYSVVVKLSAELHIPILGSS